MVKLIEEVQMNEETFNCDYEECYDYPDIVVRFLKPLRSLSRDGEVIVAFKKGVTVNVPVCEYLGDKVRRDTITYVNELITNGHIEVVNSDDMIWEDENGQ